MVVHRASQRAPEDADDLRSRLDKGRRNNHRTPQAQTRVLAQCRGADNEKWKLLERGREIDLKYGVQSGHADIDWAFD